MKDKQVRLSPQTHKLLMQHKVDTGMDIQTIVARAVERECKVGEWTPYEWELIGVSESVVCGTSYCCSKCKITENGEPYISRDMFPFCPHCGTKMKQEET